MAKPKEERFSPYKLALEFEVKPQILYYGIREGLITDIEYHEETGRPLITRQTVKEYLERDKSLSWKGHQVNPNSLQAKNAAMRERMHRMVLELRTADTDISKRYFGVEIELSKDGKVNTREKALDVLKGMNLEAKIAGATNNEHHMWLVKPDNTCALEVVTPKLRGHEGLIKLIKVLQMLNKEGAAVDVKCGLHIHWDAADFKKDLKRTIRLLLLYFFHENIIDKMMPASRKNNVYAKSLKGLDVAELTKAANLEYVLSLMETTDTYEGGQVQTNSRMWKVNVEPLIRTGTIEFRQASGTTDVEKVVNWIAFTGALMEFAAGDKIINRANNFRAMAHAIALPKPVSNWWIGRMEALMEGGE